MMRTSHTLALLAAAVGVPYAATETQLGQTALQSLRDTPAAVEQPKEPKPTSGEVHAHRDVERIWEQSVDRFRYASTPLAVLERAGVPAAPADAALGAPTAAAGGQFPSTAATVPGASSAAAPAPLPAGLGATSLVGGPIADLREVLRFDISPDWVTARFARVTTVLAETELEGLRVPVVTGIGPSDLAGSITYYFDYSGKLQRVMLHGFTGDASRVVETMTQHYGLRAEPTLDAGVYTRRWNAQPVHFLRLTRAPIVYSDALHHKFTVYLELNQPDLRYGISEEAQRIIQADRGTGRW